MRLLWGGSNIWVTLGLTLVKVGAFLALMLVVGKRLFPRLLWLVARTGSRELFTLCVIASAVSVAYGLAKLFDVSFALGAFFAGMRMRGSELSHRAAEESLPLRDAFSVLFFVSVGMLFDPRILVEEPLRVLAVMGIIMVGKTLAAVALVVALRYPLNSATTAWPSCLWRRLPNCSADKSFWCDAVGWGGALLRRCGLRAFRWWWPSRTAKWSKRCERKDWQRCQAMQRRRLC